MAKRTRCKRTYAAAMAAAATAADYSTFDCGLASFDEEQPAAFYFRGDDALEQLSDCFAVVSGVRLPMHSHVLATSAAVLKDLFLSQRGEGGAAAEVRCAAAGGDGVLQRQGAWRQVQAPLRGHVAEPPACLPLNRMLCRPSPFPLPRSRVPGRHRSVGSVRRPGRQPEGRGCLPAPGVRTRRSSVVRQPGRR